MFRAPKLTVLEMSLLAIIIALVALRFVALENDPPLYFVGHGQAMLTDPYHLSHHARNSVLFDDSHPFDIHRWDSFKNSLISGASYLSFNLFGVSRVSANFTAAALQLAGLALFTLALVRTRGKREGLITGVFLGVNNLLFFYGRLPFLECGLIFLAGLLFYLITTRVQLPLWQIIIGVTIAFAALAGKLFGALLLAPALLTLLYIYRKNVIMPALRLVGGAIGGGLLYALVFYGGDMGTVLSYYSEQTVGMYGAPPGLQGITKFFTMAMTYGGECGLYRYQPFVLLAVGFGLLFIIFTAPRRVKFEERFIPVVFCASWLVVGIVALSPFFYRPMRYSLLPLFRYHYR
jgi:4-amino-4-deoxy-L-arabinose transferase-like glycosyltransferase